LAVVPLQPATSSLPLSKIAPAEPLQFGKIPL